MQKLLFFGFSKCKHKFTTKFNRINLEINIYKQECENKIAFSL